jgi:hypothetical protein
MSIPTRALALFPLAFALGPCGPARAQDPPKPDPIAVLQEFLGSEWILEEDALGGAPATTGGLRSLLCRLRARGGFPFQKMLVAASGEVLSCSPHGELKARARAKTLRIALTPERIAVASQPRIESAGLESALRALLARRTARKAHPADALSTALNALELLSVEGEFRSAAIERAEDGALSVAVGWKQGTRFYGFEERARWSFAFDRKGALASIEKVQEAFEEHRRR